PGLMASPLGAALHWIYIATGFSGAVMAILGAVALLVRRLTDQEIRTYTTPGDLFNLCFFIISLGCLFAGFLLKGPDSPSTVAFAQAVLTFDTGVKIPGLLAVGLILSALLIAYIPFTHMSHFIGKYFTYHSVRWDDRPVLPGGKLERKLAEYLTYRPTWSAAHVGADGSKTWAEVATVNPRRETKP
ncbi:MAG: respiratory nitrate reductase subunit gamma, partial [Candidatus Tectomicrobia bacterium]|nr:respiratory nitrate reductase subunit gamma [Candidatus Tectomicrobia bacterium]